MKSFIFQSVTPRKTLFKSVICGLTLAASGQVFATIYASLANITGADLTDGTKWDAINSCSAPTAANAGTGPISMGSGDVLGVCKGTSLTLTAAYTVTVGLLAFNAASPYGAWGGGVLKYSSGNKTIFNGNPSLSSIALNVSAMTTGNEVTIHSAGVSVTFSSVTGGSLACPTGTPYTAGTAITAGTVCTVTVTPPPSAPIDLNFNKPAETFATEIEIK